jgi:Putative zinc-finger
MNCKGLEERIALLAGGDLEPAEAAPVEEHLRTCAGCAAMLRGLELDRARLAMRPPEADGADYAAMRARIRRGIVRDRRLVWLRWALPVAAAILAAVAFWEFGAFWEFHGGVRAQPVAPRANAVARIEADPVEPREVPRPGPAMPAVARGPLSSDAGLEASLEAIERAMTLPEPAGPTAVDSAEGIRIPTRDPNVIIIWCSETKGDSQ